MEFLEKELNITDSEDETDNTEGLRNGETKSEAAGNKSSIEDNIDEIEATLAKLKKELGL